MQELLSSIKSYIPQPKEEYVNRIHLLDKISSSIEKKLTIISAPAGFGKTSILSQWIYQNNIKVAWLTLDKSDNNISLFFNNLINSLEKINKNFSLSLRAIINSSQLLKVDFLANRFEEEINKSLTKHILILDDFHSIDNENIIEFINKLLSYKSNYLHIIISSRIKPNLKISKLVLDKNINEINSDELKFNKEEQKTFFIKSNSLELTNSQIDEIDLKLEGWIAGLQFYGTLIKKTDTLNNLSSNNYFIDEYLINEVFQSLDKNIQQFLIRSSILKNFNLDLLNHMLEITNSKDIIESLNNNNLFITELDKKEIIEDRNELNKVKWYKYHNFFRDFLNDKLDTLSKQQIIILHEKAIEWLDNNNYIIDALVYCLEYKQFDRYCVLLTKISMNLVMKGELQLFKNLCKDIPETVIMRFPIICLCLGWTSCLTHNLESVEKYINYTNSGYNFDNKKIHLELLNAYYYTLYFKADFKYFNMCIDLILKLKKEVKNDDVLSSAIERILGGLYIVIEDWNLALESFLIAKNLGKSSKNNIVWISSASNYCLLLIYCGEFNKAERICEETIKDLNQNFEFDSPLLSYIYQPLAKILYERGDTETAINYLEKSILLAERIDNKFLQITSLLEISLIYAYENNIKKSLDLLKKSENFLMDITIYKDIFIEFNLLKLWSIHKMNDEINIFVEKYKSERELKTNNNDYKELIYSKFLLKNSGLKESENILQELINQKEHYTKENDTKALNRFFYFDILIQLAYIYKKNLNMNKAIEILKKAIYYSIEKNYFKSLINEYKNVLDIIDLIIKENNDSLNNYLYNLIKKDNQKSSIVLTEREIEIIKLLENGFSNQEIAEKLIVAIGTIKKHTNTIYQKLNVNNRVSAIQKCKEIGLI